MRFFAALTATVLLASCQEKTEVKEIITEEDIVEQPVTATTDGDLCFLKVISRDSISINAERKNDSISGTFKWNPYEKDRKTITFKGRVIGNTVTAIGKSSAEGINNMEELVFTLTDSTASVKFGEMIEGDNGVWMYKNKNTASEEILSKVNCQ